MLITYNDTSCVYLLFSVWGDYEGRGQYVFLDVSIKPEKVVYNVLDYPLLALEAPGSGIQKAKSQFEQVEKGSEL